jgi:hypothetical protein
MKKDYSTTVHLNHDELPASVNAQTGEVKLINNNKKNNLPEGKSVFSSENFGKIDLDALTVMKQILTREERDIVMTMISLAQFNTNALFPLNEKTTQKELCETFDIGKNQIQKYINNLYDLGVFAQFKIAKYGLKEYWILNPYICFKGRTIQDSIFQNFKGTKITDLILIQKNIDPRT